MIIDPRTGKPMQSQSITQEGIVKAFGVFDQRLGFMGQNMIQMGVTLEFLLEKMLSLKDSQGNPVFDPDKFDAEFSAFHDEKMKAIDEQMQQLRSAAEAKSKVNFE